MGIYNEDGSIRVTLVGEDDVLTPRGLYAPDGSIRVTEDPGPGLYAPNGAWRVFDDGRPGWYNDSGGINGYVIDGVLYPVWGGLDFITKADGSPITKEDDSYLQKGI